MELNLEFTDFIVDVSGRRGPITFDSKIAAHSGLEYHLDVNKYNKLLQDDILILGQKNKFIRKSDIRKFIYDFRCRMQKITGILLDDFNDCRTYFFEGIGSKENDGDKIYYVKWGS